MYYGPTSDDAALMQCSNTRNEYRAQCGEPEDEKKKTNPKQIHRRTDFGVQIRLYFITYTSRIIWTPNRRRRTTQLVRRWLRLRPANTQYLQHYIGRTPFACTGVIGVDVVSVQGAADHSNKHNMMHVQRTRDCHIII